MFNFIKVHLAKVRENKQTQVASKQPKAKKEKAKKGEIPEKQL